MNYKYADKLIGYQLEPGDLIIFDELEEPVQIKSIDILQDGYQVNYLDEWDEELHKYIGEEDIVDLYVYDEDWRVAPFFLDLSITTRLKNSRKYL